MDSTQREAFSDVDGNPLQTPACQALKTPNTPSSASTPPTGECPTPSSPRDFPQIEVQLAGLKDGPFPGCIFSPFARHQMQNQRMEPTLFDELEVDTQYVY